MKNVSEINKDAIAFAHNKKVLFITTKNLDYIRNSQEIGCLEKTAALVDVVGCKDKSYIVRLFKVYLKLLTMSLKTYDVIFAGFAPQLILPIFNFKFKKKFVAEDFFISLYDTMVNDRKKFKSSGIAAKLLFWLDKITLNRADQIIVDTYAHGRYFISEFGALKEKVNVMYLKADSSIYYAQSIAKPEKLKDKFLVLYFGSILPLQGVNIILECAEKMRDTPSVVFEIIGPVNKTDMERHQYLKNVIFIPWLSQKCLAEKIAAADLCLAGHFNSEIDKASRTIPGKAYIYASMNKPMILGDNSANRELFEEDNINYYYVKMGNSDKLKEKILYAMNKKDFKENLN